ncbi:hypothetical protein AAFO92_13935 [Roseovarius sp. CAU 1744]|uniref:hypothetical protein n=1 Tax=Roseovarius sp. CAU 1744 TaxID=3140368 RepID=UPI00325B94E4
MLNLETMNTYEGTRNIHALILGRAITGQAWVAGPMTKEEAAELEMWRTRRARWQEGLEAYQADLEAQEDEGIREIIRGEFADVERVLSSIDRALSVVD